MTIIYLIEKGVIRTYYQKGFEDITARMISEGEIEGLADGFKSIFLNNTVLQNPDNSYNFQDVTVYTRNGTQNQTYIPLSGGIEDEKPVGITVEQCNLNNIKQQWEISPDENICVLE